MDLIHDHSARRLEHGAAGFGAEQDVKRLRCRDHNMRWSFAHALPLAWRRIAGPHPGSNIHLRQLASAQRLSDTGQRYFEVSVDVVRQRPKRRHVDDLRLVLETVLQTLANESINGAEKGGKRLSRARRCGNENIATRFNGRPSFSLRRGRGSETLLKPRVNRGMKDD